MPGKYKGILKIIFGIYTRCQHIDFLLNKVNSSVNVNLKNVNLLKTSVVTLDPGLEKNTKFLLNNDGYHLYHS